MKTGCQNPRTTAESPGAARRSWTYNNLGQQATETTTIAYGTAGGSTEEVTRNFGYDANGNLTSYTDFDGRVTNYTYDALGQMTTEKWFASTSATTPTSTLNYAYDVLGNMTSTSDPSSSYSYNYDALNRPSMVIMEAPLHHTNSHRTTGASGFSAADGDTQGQAVWNLLLYKRLHINS
jgi:YD repeat-containing protein